MHNTLFNKTITCPYCWESYIEDCYVCCRPIEIYIA